MLSNGGKLVLHSRLYEDDAPGKRQLVKVTSLDRSAGEQASQVSRCTGKAGESGKEVCRQSEICKQVL